MKKRILTISSLFIAIMASAQVTITIDKAKQYQKIEGFGGNIENYINNNSDAGAMSDIQADMMVNDLGATIYRHLFDGTFEPNNENNDPNNTDFSKFNSGVLPNGFDPCQGGVQYPFDLCVASYNKLKPLIEKNGEKIQLYSSVFSPPSWMKYINCVFGEDAMWNRMATDEEELSKGGTNGVGATKTKDFKDEFGEFCYAYLKTMKNKGVDIDVLSIQNEPAFPEFYSSCVYSPESYGAVFKRAGERIRKEGFNTKMMFTEDIGDLGRYNQFCKIITRDSISNTFADVAAVHAYSSNGITAGSTDASLWRNLDKVSRQRSPVGTERSFWQTETSGYKNHWDIAIAIYTGLKYGKLNAWMHHQLFTNGGLVSKDNKYKTFQYYGAKHFFKYVRPGAISVDASATDEKILATAFQHDKAKTLSVVLINADTVESKSVKLTFLQTTGLPTSYTMYLTTKETETTDNATNLCKNKGSVAFNSTIVIPAKSIVTLIGENSLPETPLETQESHLSSTSFQVYPNPSNDGFYINMSKINDQLTVLELSNAQGVLLQKIPMEANEHEKYFSTEQLQSGVYFLKSDNKYIKVVIQK